MKEIRFFPRHVAEKMKPVENVGFISFYDKSEAPAILTGWQKVLRIRCHDKDEPVLGLEIFNPENAKSVCEFLDQNPDLEAIFVHCSLGQSRSGGMALALSEFYKVPCFKENSPVDTFSYKIYNKRIYSLTSQFLRGIEEESSQSAYEKIFGSS